MSATQAPLDLVFPRRRALDRGDFVESRSNAEALALIDAPARWPDRRLALVGPEGSGKTHLVHVFMAATGAALVEAAALTEADAPRLVAAGAVAVENADRLPESAEVALFHLMNLAGAEGVSLLLTGREAPARWTARLPDLRSRLGALTPARLGPPDDGLLAAVIEKSLRDRGLAFEPGLPAFVAARIERTFAAAAAVVDRLDAASLAEARPITRRLAAATID